MALSRSIGLLASVDFLDIVETLFLMTKRKSEAQRVGLLLENVSEPNSFISLSTSQKMKWGTGRPSEHQHRFARRNQSLLRACNETLSRLTSHPEARCAAVNFRLAEELDTICGQANSAAIERPVRQNSTPRDG